MSDEEKELVNVAEIAIGRGIEPTGAARKAWLDAMKGMHHGTDLEKLLRQRVDEVRTSREKVKSEHERQQRVQSAQEQRTARENSAVRDAAVRVAADLRAGLTGVAVFGPGEHAPEPTEDVPTVLTVRPVSFDRNIGTGAAHGILEIAVHNLDGSERLFASYRGSETAVEAACRRISNPRGWERSDTRSQQRVRDAEGRESYIPVGFFLRAVRFDVFVSDPNPDEGKPTVGPSVPVRFRGTYLDPQTGLPVAVGN